MREHAVRRLVWLALLSGAALALGLAAGSVRIPWSELWSGGGEGTAGAILFGLRLPRVLTGFAVGGLLGLAGALMQVLLRNPLADPYILGISGGAAVGALGVIALGLSASLVPGGAFAGALGSILLVFALAGSDRSQTQTRLLLTGVVIAAGWGALSVIALGLSASLVPGGAFAGALGSILLVFALAGSDRSQTQTRLLQPLRRRPASRCCCWRWRPLGPWRAA